MFSNLPSYSLSAEANPLPSLVIPTQILERIRTVEGWLSANEADLLMAITSYALRKLPETPAVAEIGSYCGRSTIVMASVLKIQCPNGRFYAIDPHEGHLGPNSKGSTYYVADTYARFQENIKMAGLSDV